MPAKNSPQSVIDSYRKRQRMMPFIVGGLAVLLVAVGILILVLWLTGEGGPQIAILSTETPTTTSTVTFTPITPTITPSQTSTETVSPTITETVTPSGPFEYTVKENDTCWDIAVSFKVDISVLLALNNFGSNCPIKPGDKILIPAPNQELPTDTPVPTNLARGTKIEYTIKAGETLAQIAARFNSTVQAIIEATNEYNRKNKLALLVDQNKIYAGQILVIPVNIVTATPTLAPSSTKAATTAPAATHTAVPPTNTPAP